MFFFLEKDKLVEEMFGLSIRNPSLPNNWVTKQPLWSGRTLSLTSSPMQWRKKYHPPHTRRWDKWEEEWACDASYETRFLLSKKTVCCFGGFTFSFPWLPVRKLDTHFPVPQCCCQQWVIHYFRLTVIFCSKFVHWQGYKQEDNWSQDINTWFTLQSPGCCCTDRSLVSLPHLPPHLAFSICLSHIL